MAESDISGEQWLELYRHLLARLEERRFDDVRSAVEAAVERGVSGERIIVDPGIGFGKGTEENLELLRRLAELKDALGGMPLLVGTSRKRFLGELLDGVPSDDRVEATAATVALAIAAGADIVRVHDVAHIARTRRVADAIVRG